MFPFSASPPLYQLTLGHMLLRLKVTEPSICGADVLHIWPVTADMICTANESEYLQGPEDCAGRGSGAGLPTSKEDSTSVSCS